MSTRVNKKNCFLISEWIKSENRQTGTQRRDHYQDIAPVSCGKSIYIKGHGYHSYEFISGLNVEVPRVPGLRLLGRPGQVADLEL